MRIPGFESDPSLLKTLGIDPKVIAMLEKLQSPPLLLDKLQLDQSNSLKLIFNNDSPLSQIKLPLSVSTALAKLVESSGVTIHLHADNKTLTLEITPRSINDSQVQSNQVIKLHFAQAKLLANGVIHLSQPLLNLNHAKSNNINLNAATQAQQTAPSINQNQAQTVTLKQAIDMLLKPQTTTQTAIGQPLSVLLKNSQQLLVNIATAQNINTAKNTNENSIFTKINVTDLKELIGVLKQFQSLSPQAKALEQLINATEQLRNSIDFSKQNRRLQVEQRLANSGNFFESSLNKKSSDNSFLTGNTINLKDIKLLNLQIRDALNSLLSLMNKPNASPVQLKNLISTIVQNPNFQQYLTQQENHLAASLNNTKSSASELEFITKQINQLFQSKTLQQLEWSNGKSLAQQLLQNTKETDLSLLINQKRILNDMLKSVNSTLNKIETNQLLSLKNDSVTIQQTLVDLPILRAGNIDSFEILFESKNTKPDKKASKVWNVTVRFDLEPLGAMFARVKLKNERISTHFFAQDPLTSKLLSENIEHLENSLFAAGLDVQEVESAQGIVPDELLKNDEHSIDVKV